jgi:hypothetical protein
MQSLNACCTLNYLEEFCLPGYNAMQSVESEPKFRRNMSPPSSWSKNKPSKKHSSGCEMHCLLECNNVQSTDVSQDRTAPFSGSKIKPSMMLTNEVASGAINAVLTVYRALYPRR